ncbi:hypothetical protein J2W22_003005 [Sphingomonas kyeonggiensis]|uniref:hypothetical protein n=1 Tax=Sphingomonas kyeonggiensis TaxID=1268553 RepID=UPI00277F916F|nr:hypothetical protein [Sphingomonas kyeonggiensis]MDQ0250941.1 hypothetical protein [Sphingomonas kyeonggiensis]
MTKLRAPVSFERALVRIADHLGWDGCAAVVSQRRGKTVAVRTVTNWSEPDTSAMISLEDAFALELAYRRAGGEGSPFADCFVSRIKAEQHSSVSTAEELTRRVAKQIKEGGEANSAVVLALAPNATDADLALARRELEESIEAQQSTLALLTGGTGPDGSKPEHAPHGGAN